MSEVLNMFDKVFISVEQSLFSKYLNFEYLLITFLICITFLAVLALLGYPKNDD